MTTAIITLRRACTKQGLCDRVRPFIYLSVPTQNRESQQVPVYGD